MALNDELSQLALQLAHAEAEAAEARAAAAEAKAAALQAALAAAQTGVAPADHATPTAAEPDDPAAPAATSTAATGTAAASGAGDTAKAFPIGGADPHGEPSPHPEIEIAALSGYAADVAAGYAAHSEALTLGALLVDGVPEPRALVRLPLRSMNRHGLVAGATGTGKTRTLQLMAEGLSDTGVPVFITDIKGDLTGLAEPGIPSDALAARTRALGQGWEPSAYPVELFSLGGAGTGTPIRTTVTDFGPLLLAKVLGLNKTQESSLSLIFHWADQQGLALLDLTDIRSVISYLTSDRGKDELKAVGGVSPATAGVILRQIAQLQSQGADAFFGEPAFDTESFMRTTADGRGVISALQLPDVAGQPALFSTFAMWLLADLFGSLPEVGDLDEPRLVFFFDEAHLLFNGASDAFLAQVVQTVRLIRSKGVGVYFVTQTPKDVPEDVLAQLGSWVQHALRAHTPDDLARLKQTVKTFPHSPYDLEGVLISLGTGEAVVTVLSEKGAPTPVAATRLWAPRASMGVAAPATVDALLAGSAFMARYEHAVDNESAHELLAERMEAERIAAEREESRKAAEKEAAARAKEEARAVAAREKEIERLRVAEHKRLERERDAAAKKAQRDAEKAAASRQRTMDAFLTSSARTIGREITRTIFGTRKR